jgi:hypothetical protein
VPVSIIGHNLVKIGLTDLPKIGVNRPDIEALKIEKIIHLPFWSCTK